MAHRFAFDLDMLSADDLSNLKRLASQLDVVRHEVARDWSQRLADLFPESFAGGAVSVDELTQVNEAFLALVLDHASRADLSTLFETYYAMNRNLIEADLQRAPALRISLSNLYTSARVSVQAIEAHLADRDPALMTAYTKLTAELMMIVGQAYSDAREAYLQRAFEQISTLSHELRAPLSHLFGYLELLQAGGYGPVSDEQEAVLGQLMHETDDLLWLLTGTLDVSRLNTGRVDVRIEEFQLSDVFTDVVKSTPSFAGKVTCVLPADLPPLRTDRIKVKQIVGNLVRNAVRCGGRAPVELQATLPGAGVVQIDVRDHGPGIATEDLGVIFDLFERRPGGGGVRDGYGIGLHVVQRLVTLLGGTITVDSAPGAGSCFRVTLPTAGPAM